MKFLRISVFCSALMLGISSLLIINAPVAFAATRTWDGGGGDDNMNTAANWTGDVAPSAGDDLVFPANQPRLTITNDYPAATSFNSMTFSGTATQDSGYTISGNSITLVGGIVNSMTTSNESNTAQALSVNLILNSNQTFSVSDWVSYLALSGVISGSGNLTKSGSGGLILSGSNTYTGTTTINGGEVRVDEVTGFGTTAAGTTVNNGATIWFTWNGPVRTYSEPLTLSGAGVATPSDHPAYPFKPIAAKLFFQLGYGPLEGEPDKLVVLDGPTTLASDIDMEVAANNVQLNNVTKNGYKITLRPGAFGTVTVNGETQTPADPKLYTLADNQPAQDEVVGNNEKFIVNGQRANTSVYYDGILSGSGTLGNLTLRNGSTFAPGTSPGCMNTNNIVFTGSTTYEAELAGTTVCTQYDQTRVTGTVSLGGAKLTTLLLNNFRPVVGNSFTLITNDGVDAVSGTFANLAEGASFTVSGFVFRISYIGGDGNDVVITVLTVPASPDTGYKLVKVNPLLPVAVGTLLATALLFQARRTRYASKR